MTESENVTRLVKFCKEVAKGAPRMNETFALLAQVVEQQSRTIEELKTRVGKLENPSTPFKPN